MLKQIRLTTEYYFNQDRPYIELSDKLVPIIDFEHLYKVNNKGEVFSIKNNQFVKPGKVGEYMGINLYNAKGEIKIKRYLVHRLIAIMFIPNPNNLPEVNHIDGDKLNNNPNNLEWSNSSLNSKHAYKIGLMDNVKIKNSLNKRKLNEEQVRKVEELKGKGFGATYISRELNLPYAAVRNFIQFGYINANN